jgi:hypothetical protein
MTQLRGTFELGCINRLDGIKVTVLKQSVIGRKITPN